MADAHSITLNGERFATVASTIGALAKELEIDPAKIAVECNGEIVPRDRIVHAPLGDGDVLEIVHFVGGG